MKKYQKSRCESCGNFVYQAVMSKSLSNGVIFKGTVFEREGRVSVYSLCGCLHAKREWERKSPNIKKPRGIACGYKERI